MSSASTSAHGTSGGLALNGCDLANGSSLILVAFGLGRSGHGSLLLLVGGWDNISGHAYYVKQEQLITDSGAIRAGSQTYQEP